VYIKNKGQHLCHANLVYLYVYGIKKHHTHTYMILIHFLTKYIMILILILILINDCTNNAYMWKKKQQDNVGWGVGLGVLAGVLAMALALFLFGIKRYRKEGPTGSPFTRLAQVFVASFRKWHMQETLLHSNNFCYSEEEKLEPQKYHTLLHTRQYRWVTL
jgi:uncharacterized integral membrane protein